MHPCGGPGDPLFTCVRAVEAGVRSAARTDKGVVITSENTQSAPLGCGGGGRETSVKARAQSHTHANRAVDHARTHTSARAQRVSTDGRKTKPPQKILENRESESH